MSDSQRPPENEEYHAWWREQEARRKQERKGEPVQVSESINPDEATVTGRVQRRVDTASHRVTDLQRILWSIEEEARFVAEQLDRMIAGGDRGRNGE